MENPTKYSKQLAANFLVLALIVVPLAAAHAQTIYTNGSIVAGHPGALAMSGNDLFVGSSASNGSVGLYNSSNGATLNATLITNLGGTNPESLGAWNNGGTEYLYVGNYGGIQEYTVTSTVATVVKKNFITGLGSLGSISIYNGNLFVVNDAGNTYSSIYEYSATTGLPISTNPIISNLADTFGMTVANGFIYTVGYDNGIVQQFDLNGNLVNNALVTGLGFGASGLAVSNGKLYVTDTANETIGVYDVGGGSALATYSLGSPTVPITVSILGAAAAPEPSTWVLMLAGLGLLAFGHVRRRRNSAQFRVRPVRINK